MANNKRTIYLGLDYSEFSGGISDINRKMGLLDSEFKLAQEQAKNYGTETDKLGTKIDYLKQKIILQSQKVEESKIAYDKAMSSQSATQKEIDRLDKKLLDERTALEKLKGALSDAEEEQGKLTGATQSFGDEIRDMASSLGLDVSPAVENFAKMFDGVNKSVGNAIVVVGAVGGVLTSFSKGLAETSDNILTMSSVTGIATDDLQKLEYASKFVDVEVTTMTDSIAKMTRNMSNARDGSSDASEAFQKLGIRITDAHGQLRDANDVFLDAIDRLGKVKNETERDAAAMEIFGRSAKELNPLIEAGSGKLKELGDEAENLGFILNDEQLKQGGELQDALDKLSSATDNLKNKLGVVLAPVLTWIVDTIAEIPAPVLIIAGVLGSIIGVTVKLTTAMKEYAALQALVAATNTMSSVSFTKVAVIVVAVVGVFALLLMIIKAFTGSAKDAENEINSMAQTAERLGGSISSSVEKANQISTNAPRGYASGTDDYPGGQAWVGENGPELVTLPRGSRITPNNEVGHTEVYNIELNVNADDIKSLQSVVDIVQGSKMAARRVYT